MRARHLMTAALAAAVLATPALAWRGGGFGGGFRGGGFDRGGFDRGGFGGDDFHGSWGGYHDDSGWSHAAGGADWYHGANGGAYRPPQMTDTGYKPPAAFSPGTEYHPPAAAVGESAYHPAGVAVGGDAFHPPVAATGYHYPGGVYGYPHGYYGYGYHPYAWYGATGIVASSLAINAFYEATWFNGVYYPYGVISPVAYTWGYAPANVYTQACGGMTQPICSTPEQMWSQSYANSVAAGQAIAAAAGQLGTAAESVN